MAEPKPPRWHTREDSGLRIDRAGRWFHDDEPIEHPRIIEAFNRGLSVTDDGRYRLDLGADWAFVTVEGAAFTVVAFDVSEGDRPSIRLSDRTAEWLAVDTLALDDADALTVAVKHGRARARFSREAHVQLAQLFEERDGRLWLKVGAKEWLTPLPSLG